MENQGTNYDILDQTACILQNSESVVSQSLLSSYIISSYSPQLKLSFLNWEMSPFSAATKRIMAVLKKSSDSIQDDEIPKQYLNIKDNVKSPDDLSEERKCKDEGLAYH